MLLLSLSLILYQASQCASNVQPVSEDGASKLSLSQCVLEASKRFFTKSFGTISFTLPRESGGDRNLTSFTQLTLRTLATSNLWPLYVRNLTGNVLTFDQISKTYNYIVQIRDESEFIISIKKLKSLLSWNPHARFLIVSSTVFEDPNRVAAEVTQALWTSSAINGVVLLANPGDATNFTAYTWYPYSKQNCNNQRVYSVPINYCSFGKIHSNRSWYEEKIPKQMNNCTIKVNYVDWPPYVINATGGFQLSNYFNSQGLEVNLVNMIAANLNLFVEYGKSETWGTISADGAMTGDLGLLLNNSVDILIGGYGSTSRRSLYFDLTRPYLQEGFIWCVPHSRTLLGFNNMINIISGGTWVFLIAIYFSVSFFIWYQSQSDGSEAGCYRSFPSSLLNNFAVILGLPITILPKTIKVRYLMTLLILLGINVSIMYNTYLTSIISTARYTEKYSTMANVYKYNLKTYFMPNFVRYFRDGDRTVDGVPMSLIRRRWRVCNDLNFCLDQVAKLGDSAVCTPKMYKDYLLATRRGNFSVHCTDKSVVTFPILMLMRKGFPLFQIFDEHFAAIVAGGFIAKWERDIIGRRNVDSSSRNDFDKMSMKFKNLYPVFLMVIGGCAVALMVFVGEILVYRRNKSKGVEELGDT